jgi:hypothetical protein
MTWACIIGLLICTVATFLAIGLFAGPGPCRCSHPSGDHDHYGSSGATWCATCPRSVCRRYRPAHGRRRRQIEDDSETLAAVADGSQHTGPVPSPVAWIETGYGCGCRRRISAMTGEWKSGRFCRDHNPFREWEEQMAGSDS